MNCYLFCIDSTFMDPNISFHMFLDPNIVKNSILKTVAQLEYRYRTLMGFVLLLNYSIMSYHFLFLTSNCQLYQTCHCT